MRAERGHVLEERDPFGSFAARALEALAGDLLASLARDLTVALAEGRVADRRGVHHRPHRRGHTPDRLGPELGLLAPDPDEVVLAPHSAELVGHRSHDPDVLLVQGRVDHHGRVDPRLGAAPRRDRGIALAAQSVQVLSWNALSRHAVRAASSTSSGWKGLTPSISRSSGKP